MSADERLAIWRYATPEERQRVIDAPEGWGPEHGIQVPLNVFMRDEEPCCPWGAAFIGEDDAEQHIGGNPAFPLAEDIAAILTDRAVPADEDWTENRHDEAYRRFSRLAAAFTTNWDKCNIAPRELIAYLRRLNDVEATQ